MIPDLKYKALQITIVYKWLFTSVIFATKAMHLIHLISLTEIHKNPLISCGFHFSSVSWTYQYTINIIWIFTTTLRDFTLFSAANLEFIPALVLLVAILLFPKLCWHIGLVSIPSSTSRKIRYSYFILTSLPSILVLFFCFIVTSTEIQRNMKSICIVLQLFKCQWYKCIWSVKVTPVCLTLIASCISYITICHHAMH